MIRRSRYSVLTAFAATFALVAAATVTAAPPTEAAPAKAKTPPSVRLYVLDCGTLHIADLGRFRLKPDDVTTTDLSVACFLVAHPKGTLMWDPGTVADAAWKPTGAAVTHRLAFPDGSAREITLRRSLTAQLSEIGYSPADVTFLALSHYHYDHTANANLFAGSTWLVRKVERDAMFADPAPKVTLPSSYAALRGAKTRMIEGDEADVFGDGTVVIKAAPGHTPGHQVLYVNLPKTGAVVLSGDLYHYSAARQLKRVPTFDFDEAQSAVTREALERWLSGKGAQLWIQHDSAANAKLKKSPAYYE